MDIEYNRFIEDILYYNKLENINKHKHINKQSECILINTDGRKLKYIKNESIDAIVTDHPWKDRKSQEGTNQKNLVEEYKDSTFNYTESHIREKYRVLKEGAYCVEVLPQISITNITWMIEILNLFLKNGFIFQTSVDWVKGKILKLKSNDLKLLKNIEINKFLNKHTEYVNIFTDIDKYFNGEMHEEIEDNIYEIISTFKQCQGKKIKDGDVIYFFTKGKARNLKPDYVKIKKILREFSGKKSYRELYKEVFSKKIDYLQDNEFANKIIHKKWRNTKEILSQDKAYKLFKQKFNMERQKYELKNEYLISGTDILPARFIVPQVNPSEKIHDSEKPVELYREIISFITKEGEVVLDQFSGSGNLGKACNDLNRSAILIEKSESIYNKCNENINKNSQ